MKLRRLGLFVIAVSSAACIAWAQSTSTSQSTSRQGGATASATSSSRSSGSQSSTNSANQQGGVFSRATLPPTHALLYQTGPNWVEGKTSKEQKLQDHGAYMARLVEEGVLIFAGPWRDEAGIMVLIRVRSDEEAEAVMARDPGVRDGILAGEIKAWDVVFQGTGSPVKPLRGQGKPE